MIKKVYPPIITLIMIRYLFFSFSVSLALLSTLGLSSTSAQTPLEQDSPYPSSEQDTFSTELGDGFKPFDLIHQSNFRRSRSLEEYRLDQQQNLDSAASQFRQQQQHMLQQQPQNTTEDTKTPEE